LWGETLVTKSETNPFEGAKRPRTKKTDAERIEEIRAELDKQVPPVSEQPVTPQEAELDLQQIGEETAEKPASQPAPKAEKPMQ